MRGTLTVFAGPMFAGKSARLLQSASLDAATLCLSPAFDTRSGASIHSRTGLTHPARPVSAWPDDAGAYRHLLLDEAHFMVAPHYRGDVVDDIRNALSQGVTISVAGLDTDYLREAFDVMTRLRGCADRFVSLQARCHCCGSPARWTAKKRRTGHKLEAGDDELYEARCDAHWSAPECA